MKVVPMDQEVEGEAEGVIRPMGLKVQVQVNSD